MKSSLQFGAQNIYIQGTFKLTTRPLILSDCKTIKVLGFLHADYVHRILQLSYMGCNSEDFCDHLSATTSSTQPHVCDVPLGPKPAAYCDSDYTNKYRLDNNSTHPIQLKGHRLIYTQKYDTNTVTTVHTLAPTNTNTTHPASTLAQLTQIYYSNLLRNHST